MPTRQTPRASIFASGKPKALVKWLKSTGAARLRCETDDGDKLVPCATKRGGRQESAVAKTVLALGALKVEALDEAGDTLDVFRLVEPEADPSEGAYTRSEDDTPDERVLKTFGQLLAAAHHSAARQLVDTVQLMSKHFSEERQALRGQTESLERLNQRLARRVRVASDPDAEEESGNAPGEENFVEELIGNIVKAKMAKGMADAAGVQAPVNGAGGKA